ncbi:hypothetical protein A2960_03075 [Candidatus Gottesmanbacteria bacterium RIFCSPLOWO2_01_FULL_39_12b]|uniref:O-antigen ligase-related domain-containing protein n=1 Tax=Candidatus Gottesmanbacteria bacterium RIFCSPLOWO2_01_FULL_39_12b TaxID=1798388 RepID=A0A1F6AQX1_9BACT|nr:MAG: hypothetical protein A2960_03075 [Candidatus Gottesmanbacteria bacterium RIFCSPLOWO2_01_FULL_39_12b]
MVPIPVKITDKIIQYSFYLLFFLVPLILTPFNYELFEYNKMMAVYGLTMIILCAWVSKMILKGRLNLIRTPFDIPLFLFLVSQIISTLFSIDSHVSIWGYYSRFNGGLISIISYLVLFYAFVSNFPKEKISRLLKVILLSGLIVAAYGILERFGIDKDLWVQDVQNRVFSTLGQPNWLAAYLAVLIPLTIGIALQYFTNQFSDLNGKIQNSKVKSQNYNAKFKNTGLLDNWIIGLLLFISNVFYLTLVFTKSRSGFIGLWSSLIVLWSIFLIPYLFHKLQPQKITHIHATASICVKYIKLIGIYIFSFILISFFFGTPFQNLNRLTLPEILSQKPEIGNRKAVASPGSSVIEIGITESGTIRNIVWKGALQIVKNYPLFGSGVETFAYAYYKYRPVEHNMTSEWDFLYNKAHNEYLNYAATTGFIGLGTYLLFIGSFIWWNINKLKAQNNLDFGFDLNLWILSFGLFVAWLSILITNFFGFSVVIIQLFFFLIPAISFLLSKDLTFASPPVTSNRSFDLASDKQPVNNFQYGLILICLLTMLYGIYRLSVLWSADVLFASGYHESRSSQYTSAYQSLRNAILANPDEPLYYDEFSLPASQIAVALKESGDSSTSAQLEKEAILSSDQAVSISPNNVNFWKTRTRVFYTLSQLSEINTYLEKSLEALVKAHSLAPTDPKVSYNLALLYDKKGEKEESMKLLEETRVLKPDYRDAYFTAALFYERDKKKDRAREMLKFILNRLNPNDEDAKKRLEEIK